MCHSSEVLNHSADLLLRTISFLTPKEPYTSRLYLTISIYLTFLLQKLFTIPTGYFQSTRISSQQDQGFKEQFLILIYLFNYIIDISWLIITHRLNKRASRFSVIGFIREIFCRLVDSISSFSFIFFGLV